MKKTILSLVAICSFSAIYAQAWTVMANLPGDRKFCGAATGDKFIYVMGGYDNGGGIHNENYAYNPTNNTWATVAPMPHQRGEFGVVAVAGKIYAMGGYDGSGTIDYLDIYNPATNTWTSGAAMPIARSQFSVAAVGGKIYVTGGYPGSFTNLDIYDPTTNTWTAGAPMPFGLIQNNGGAALGNKFYVIGGKDYSSSVTYNTTYVYEPATNTWNTAANLPATRFGGPATMLDGKIYYMGGSTSVLVPAFDNNYCYDAATNTWSSALPMISSRTSAATATFNKSIYIFGGTNSSSSVVNWTHKFTPDTSGSTTGINEQPEEAPVFSIYPNPTTDNGVQVALGSANMHGDATAEVYDVTGRLVQTLNIKYGTPANIHFDHQGEFIVSVTIGTRKTSKVVLVN